MSLTLPIIAGSAAAAWILASAKKSRSDGSLIRKLHPYRKLMPYVMISRNESVVYFDTYVNAEPLLDYLEKAKEVFHCDITHAGVASVFLALCENPSMNHFVSGKRLYKREGEWITFSMKRKKKDKKAKLTTVKKRLLEGETFRQLCERIQGDIEVERSSKRTYADKEFDLFNMLPRPVMVGAQKLFLLLDYYNLLPGGFIENDGMYTSVFVANLGSLGMDPGFHHLYEWGNAPLFMMIGQIQDKPVVREGEIVVQKTMHIRWSYDERIDDGLSARFGIDSAKHALEHPFEYFGCLAEDGSDARPLDSVRGD